MREIKYRAWDRIDHRMRYEDDVEGIKEWPSLLAVGFNGRPICIDSDSFDGKEIKGWDCNHNLILMQYTGLKDKNGKEIYEGDIVQGKNRLFENQIITQRVTFLNGCYMFGNWNAHEYFNQHQEIEIIGNIYEGEKS